MSFAQSIDSISGGAGWVGAGLLGLVLSWLLLKHLPDNAKQLRDMISDKDARFQQMLLEKDKQLLDKDHQVSLILDHKWAAIQVMSTDRVTEVKLLAAEFRTVLNEHIAVATKEAAENREACNREIERWYALWRDSDEQNKSNPK